MSLFQLQMLYLLDYVTMYLTIGLVVTSINAALAGFTLSFPDPNRMLSSTLVWPAVLVYYIGSLLAFMFYKPKNDYDE